jgi:hypothetical protein
MVGNQTATTPFSTSKQSPLLLDFRLVNIVGGK